MGGENEDKDKYSEPDDYLEELSTDSSLLTTPAFRGIHSTSRSNSASSGVGSLNSSDASSNQDCSNNATTPSKTIYVNTRLPPPKGSPWRIIAGMFIMFLSVVSFVHTPFDVLMKERLKMVPGFPAFDWWQSPPDEVLLKVYIFNVTNGEDFMSGTDDVLRMQEVGPFVYIEKLVHTDVVFNDNNTLTYTAHRSAIFQPHLTNFSLQDRLLVPNLAVLGGASYMSTSSFFHKFGFNMMLGRTKSTPLVSLTAEQYMWNWTDPLIELSMTYVPSMVPVENIGILNRIYSDFVDNVTVLMGQENARKFFLVDQFHGRDRLGYWEGEQCDNMQGSTEGVAYPEFLTKQDKVHYLRKTICRVATLHYAKEVELYNIPGYRWELPHNTYHRPPAGSEDCFTRPGEEPLPDGVSDMSPCYFNYPIAVSLPHFMGAAPDVEPRVGGMQPDDEKHGSYVVVEPLTGVPMQSRARSQSNLVVKKLSGFSANVTRFSDMILPMFWLEYGQQGLPSYVSNLMYFTVVFLPAWQHWISFAIFLIGLAVLYSGVYQHVTYITQKLLHNYTKLDAFSLQHT